MTFDQTLITAYGIFLLSGAYFGWKAGSKISVIMGLLCGALALIAAYFLSIKPQCVYPSISILTGVLSLVFLRRYQKTKKFMPGGMLLIVSFGIFILFACRMQALQ